MSLFRVYTRLQLRSLTTSSRFVLAEDSLPCVFVMYDHNHGCLPWMPVVTCGGSCTHSGTNLQSGIASSMLDAVSGN